CRPKSRQLVALRLSHFRNKFSYLTAAPITAPATGTLPGADLAKRRALRRYPTTSAKKADFARNANPRRAERGEKNGSVCRDASHATRLTVGKKSHACGILSLQNERYHYELASQYDHPHPQTPSCFAANSKIPASVRGARGSLHPRDILRQQQRRRPQP